MKRAIAALALVAAAAFTLAACGSDTGDSSSGDQSSSAAQPTNKRGAIEVNLGEPVTVRDSKGDLVVTISDTRLDSTGCEPIEGATRIKFVSTIETGNYEMQQWLWPSDMYYVDASGKSAQNIDVEQKLDDFNPCSGSNQFIDTPKNSTVDGSPTLLVPATASLIGYHLKVGDVDQRIEWRLPSNWQVQASSSAAASATS